MYEQHFGLKKRPFRAKATGTDVFVGPQTATIMAGLKKALTGNDAIASVSGPVGSGKTTLVVKALDSMAGQQKVVRIGRMQLQSSDVLQLLLDELEIENQPIGAIQKFNRFRQRLKELEDCGTRLIIAVEDSPRLSVDTLAEIEALTAADSGVSEGANVVLMGDDSLHELLRNPQLSRLQQRTRQKLQTTPLCAAELRGYLRHCFRLAGGDFEQVFEPNAALLLHHLTSGIPRVANAVLESAMTAAADQGLDQVSSELLAQIGESEFGFSAAGFEFTPVPAAAPPVTPVVEESVPEAAAEPLPDIEEPMTVFADAPQPADLPELIQDTLPDLEILAPELAGTEASTPTESEVETLVPVLAIDTPVEIAETPEPDVEAPQLEVEVPEPVAEAPLLEVEVPEPVVEAALLEVEAPEPFVEAPLLEVEAPEPSVAASTLAAEELPEWDRDPTMAELRPDIEALEQAMAFAPTDEADLPTAEAARPSNSTPNPMDSIPEITLDNAISQRIDRKLVDEPDEISLPVVGESDHDETKPEIPALKIEAKKLRKSDTAIEKIAAGLSRARSLEDVDDKMAETLFGDDFSLVASQFMKKPLIAESANDDSEVAEKNEGSSEIASGEQQIATADTPAANNTSADALDFEVTLESTSQPCERGMDLSASQRLKTVRALNAELHPSLREPEAPGANGAPPIVNEAPESIEDQLNISMTQMLKALKIKPPVSSYDVDEYEDEQKGKTGFFSRFKRS